MLVLASSQKALYIYINKCIACSDEPVTSNMLDIYYLKSGCYIGSLLSWANEWGAADGAANVNTLALDGNMS